MQHIYDVLVNLTAPDYPGTVPATALNDFAQRLGWHPSDSLDVPELCELTNVHLVVEHGLENTAVISFLRSPCRYEALDTEQKRALLNVSYNSLVDWHISIQADQAAFIYNRSSRGDIVAKYSLSRQDVDALRKDTFDQIAGKKPNANIPALDNALVRTISLWKRTLAAELGELVTSDDLSALFNAIIFVRAVEDHLYRAPAHISSGPLWRRRMLMEEAAKAEPASLRLLLTSALDKIPDTIPDSLLDFNRLQVFDAVPQAMVQSLLADFYQNKFAHPYQYDFSLISKHALSRIYERYVAVLRMEESAQIPLPIFSSLPLEELDKAYGHVYTPQFIARFLARYLREQLPPPVYRNLRVADPACGSGIFLRTLLELQCDPTHNGVTTEFVQSAFANTVGMDVDPNACQATRLSLSLLHLVLTNHLPKDLNIINDEAVDYFQTHPEVHGTCDAVFANPPFVSLGTQSQEMRRRISEFMDSYAGGRTDLYLAFLRIGLELLRPGGYGLFVLPHSFLLSESAAKMRALLAQETWIRLLADLTAVRIFPDSQTYVILLVFQKKDAKAQPDPPALIVRCRDLIGRALQDALDERTGDTVSYSIYDIPQSDFADRQWVAGPRVESHLRRRLQQHPVIDDFLQIRVGFISGDDDVFIRPASGVPQQEKELWVPFLHDREMEPYVVRNSTARCVFHPYVCGSKIDEATLKSEFPWTWRYLCKHKRRLESRKSHNGPWWAPGRPRKPEHILRPKIVTPHLTLAPRFSLDIEGKYAVSRSPLLYPKENATGDDLLPFFLAVLNSTTCFSQISRTSHRYERGYVMLEPKSMRSVPVPDPAKVPPSDMLLLLNLVSKRLVSSPLAAIRLERELDGIVADMYGISTDERKALGIQDG